MYLNHLKKYLKCDNIIAAWELNPHHQVGHHYSASWLLVHLPYFQSEHLLFLYCDQIGHSVQMLSSAPQTLQTAPEDKNINVSHVLNNTETSKGLIGV